MERRKAITTAAAASITLLAGAAGMAISSNIVGAASNDDVGQLSPVSSVENPQVTVYVDDLPALTGTVEAPSVQGSDATALTTSSASGYQDDDEYDDDEYEDEEYEDEEEHEYEGGDDDD